jgi:hypothetical protein
MRFACSAETPDNYSRRVIEEHVFTRREFFISELSVQAPLGKPLSHRKQPSFTILCLAWIQVNRLFLQINLSPSKA